MRKDRAVVPLLAKGGTGLGIYPSLDPVQNVGVPVGVYEVFRYLGH